MLTRSALPPRNDGEQAAQLGSGSTTLNFTLPPMPRKLIAARRSMKAKTSSMVALRPQSSPTPASRLEAKADMAPRSDAGSRRSRVDLPIIGAHSSSASDPGRRPHPLGQCCTARTWKNAGCV